MNNPIYPISETIKYSDGSEKVILFNLPEEQIAEDEIDAELSKVEEVVESPVSEPADPMEGGIPKEAEEAPADSIEEVA